jgi:hypothetical protein
MSTTPVRRSTRSGAGKSPSRLGQGDGWAETKNSARSEKTVDAVAAPLSDDGGRDRSSVHAKVAANPWRPSFSFARLTGDPEYDFGG